MPGDWFKYIMKYKKCNLCEKLKPRDEFYRLSSPKYKEHWDCRDSYCKKCRIDYGHRRRLDIKKKAVEYLGGKCRRCGLATNHIEVYDFHHNDPTKKDIAIGKRALAFETIKSELDKCSLYCANCHRIIHYGLQEFLIMKMN